MKNSFFAHLVCSLNPNNRKETAMKKLILAAIVAVTLALATSASAQTPAASSASAKAPTPPPAVTASASFTTSTSSAPAPKSEASPLFPIKSLPEFINFAEFVRLYYLVETQKGWDATAKKSAKDILKSETLFGQFGILFGQITNVLEGTGNKAPSDTAAAFTKYLEANDCRKTGETPLGDPPNQVMVPTYSPGCTPLLESIQGVYTKVLPKVPEGDRKENAKHVMARVAKYDGPNAVALAHVALLGITFELTEADRPWKLTDSNVSDYFKGRDVCVTRKDGGDKVCGKIEKTGLDGVTINGVPISLDSIRSICFGSESECKEAGNTPSFAAQHRFSVGVRGFYRFGSAEGYKSPSMPGFMAVGEYHITDNLSVHAGLGGARIRGKSILGNVENDSPTMFAAMAGSSVLLGSRNWVVAPVLELNATMQGSGFGAEVGLGAEVLPGSPVDIRVLGTFGTYPTNQTPFVNGDGRSTPSFHLGGAGISLQGGYSF